MHLDLNLLVALDALLEEGSVGGAAERLHVTSPAMSRTLGRIRRVTGDQILVRTGRSMTPTPHAVAMHARVHELVHQAQVLLSPEREVDRATLERTFTLRWHDALTIAYGPALLTAVRAQAPGVRLRFLPEAAADTHELRRGEVDLEAGAGVPQLPQVRHELVGESRLVVAMRTGHPLAAGELTAQRYAAAEHVAVSRRGSLADQIDDVLAEAGLHREVVTASPTIAVALQLARLSDLVVTVPDVTSRGLLVDFGLVARPLPLDVPPVPIRLAWHQRYDSDPGHTWLREQARAVLLAQPGAA
jgi:DNA-binding transcriptional LysR family regulator